MQVHKPRHRPFKPLRGPPINIIGGNEAIAQCQCRSRASYTPSDNEKVIIITSRVIRQDMNAVLDS